MKVAVLVILVATVWFGFRYLERRNRVEEGQRRPRERTMGERLRKSMRERGGEAPKASREVGDTEECPICKSYVAVDGISNCGKPRCPY